MPTKFWASDGTAFREADILWVYTAGAWKRVRKAWVYSDGAWRQVYQIPTLSSLLVIRDACTDTSGHIVSWTTEGKVTGWTITIERRIGGGSYAVVASGVDPTLGTKTIAYGGGNSQTGTDFRVSLVRGVRSAQSSPREKLAPITLC